MHDSAHQDDRAAGQRFALAVLAYSLEQIEHHRHHLKHHLMVSGSVAFLGLCAVWVVGNIYGVRFDLQGTMLSGINSDSQLAQSIQTKTSNYRLRIAQPDGSIKSFSLAQVGLKVSTNKTVEVARQQQRSLASRLQWWRPVKVDIITSTDSQVMADFIAHHATVAVTPAQNASLSIDNGDVKVSEGVAGKQYGFKTPAQTIRGATLSLSSAPLHMHSLPLPPGITADKLASVKKQVDATLKQTITITIDGEAIHPSNNDVANWISLTPDVAHKTENLAVNADNVRSYLTKLASDHSRPPRNEVALDGSTIQGAMGVSVTGVDAAVATITQTFLQNKGVQVDLPVTHTSFRKVQAPTSGKWIEVDLTTKRLYVYAQNSLIRTFLVSAGARATPTVTGTYAIYAKYVRQTMSGGNADGSHYIQPDVPWVNYFYRDYAIHGNYWRPTSYFGNINSSHGCVGLKTGDAGWVYDWAPIGTPVVIHY